MGYDRFLENLPADTWRYLPHTFASVMSDGLWTPYPYLVMISNILATVIARGGGRILISVPPRHGKLIADDTNVPTPGGWKLHGDLRKDDYVFGRDGRPVKVLGVSPKDNADCMVVFSDGQQILAHENHEWVVQDRSCHNAKEKILETKFFLENSLSCEGKRGSRGHRNRFQVDANTTLHFPEQNLPLHPYFLGVWLGDGRSTSPDFCGSADDVAIIAAKLETFGYQTSSRWIHKDTGVHYYYYSDGVSKILRNLKVMNNKHIPNVYLFASFQQRMDLLAGLVDTDGHRDPRGRYRISTCNEKITHQIKVLVNSLGGYCYVMKIEPILSSSGIQGKQVVYQVGFNLPHVLPVALERKSNKNTPYVHRRRAIVDVYKVVPGRAKPGHCIQVEGGVYLVGETMILTHNSWFISQWLPVWFLSMWPEKRVLLSTYEANFAATWGRRARNIVKEKGSRVGLYLADDATASNNWATTMDGGMVTAGVGGPITGKGCVTGDTVIYTNLGIMTIEQYFRKYSLHDNIYVLTYQESDDSVIFNKIIARRELTTHEIYTIDGNLKLTGNHPVYDREYGYRPTRDLEPGSPILSIKTHTSRELRRMWKTQTRQWGKVSNVLPCRKTSKWNNFTDMFNVWKEIPTKSQSTQNGHQGWLQKILLLPRMQSVFENRTISLPHMWKNVKETISALLQPGMQTYSDCRRKKEKKDTRNQTVSDMSNPISANFTPYKVLFKALRRCCAFIADGWKGKLELQGRDQLREGLPGNKTIDSGTGWQRLCRLWINGRSRPCEDRTGKEQSDRSSSGCQRQKQCPGEPGNSLRGMSRNSPPLFRDTIQTITRDCSGEHVVYDIEVEGTHNYFANQKTLKNCHLGLIDDPHKNWQEAQSPTILKNIQEWFDSTFYTRLEPGGTIVAMHTRWAENDLIGYLMREKLQDGWFYIRIPAIAENWKGDEDVLGRADGQALCPQRYDEAALNRIKSNMTAQMWNALFQQRPAAQEGSIFLRDKWKYYTICPHCSFIVQSWDTASKKNWDSAYSVCQTWGVSEKGAVLIDQWRDKVEYPQLLRQAKIQYMEFRPSVVLIEDKDSGQALIQSLRQDTFMPILAVVPDMDKITRAQAISPMQESERLFLPDPTIQGNLWVSEFVDNCCTFPNSFFKDEIDTMSQAVAYIMTMAMTGQVMSFERRKTSKLLEGYRRLM